MKQSFKDIILNIVEVLAKEKHLEYSIDNYETENDDELLNLTDIIIEETKITISNDFALVVISGNQYDFEEWRYKNNNELFNEFKELLAAKL